MKSILIKGGIYAAVMILGLSLIYAMGGTAKAEVKTLQQSVEMAQADYDLSQSQTKDALIQACESWKALAIAKAELSEAMKISSTLNSEGLKTKDCGVAADLLPASF